MRTTGCWTNFGWWGAGFIDEWACFGGALWTFFLLDMATPLEQTGFFAGL
jgi:hypothetical protein